MEVEELMAVHGAMAATRVDPEEHLISAAADDMVQALAQMKSPNNYPLTRPFCIMLLYRYLLHYGL